MTALAWPLAQYGAGVGINAVGYVRAGGRGACGTVLPVDQLDVVCSLGGSNLGKALVDGFGPLPGITGIPKP